MEGGSKNKRLMDMGNSVVIVGEGRAVDGGERVYKGINGNGKNYFKYLK